MPKRKIYDIKPPKIAHKIEKELKEFLGDDKKKVHHARRHKKERYPSWLPVLIGILVGVVLVGVYLFFKLPRANVTIWPRVDTLSFKQTITADKSVDSIDSLKNIIPAKYFEATKTITQDFPASGNASDEGQAQGTITVYNKYDPPMPFTLKTGTHFISDSGKLFVAPQKIVIPAAKKVGGKIVPGSVQVNIRAVEGGADYNISPSNFSIPKLKGTAYYYSLYATSTSAMAGGYSGKIKKVTDDDIQSAKSVLTKKTIADAISDVKKQIPSDYILLDNAVLSNVASASTQAKPGAVAQTFSYKVTANASALAFKKSDLDQFAKDYILSQFTNAAEKLLDSAFKINYSANTVDVSGGKAELNLDFSSGVYKNIDKNSMTLLLFGKDANQIKETINNNLGDRVSKIKINFWPFWVRSAPNSQKAISVDLKFQ